MPISTLQARFVYLIQGTCTDPKSQATLNALLQVEAGEPPIVSMGDRQLLVTPRKGTVSPWCSRVRDILAHCGVDWVQRVERAVLYEYTADAPLSDDQDDLLLAAVHDSMTESVLRDIELISHLFLSQIPEPAGTIDVLRRGHVALERFNTQYSVNLLPHEVDHVETYFKLVSRNPSDAEVMMYSQINSEHCRHKKFNANWSIDGEAQPLSMMDLVRRTDASALEPALSAYSDNAAVMHGHTGCYLSINPTNHRYGTQVEPLHIQFKAETHNHPTAISPLSGAATGSGGEIRDEVATGLGARTKMAMCGFSVSHLHIPDYARPWEIAPPRSQRIASALEVMREAPIGAALFNNEFGRPCLAGYFRTYEQMIDTADGQALRAYHKPIMIAGGLGSVRAMHARKRDVLFEDTLLVLLGGPAMSIGMGGGSASSVNNGQIDAETDYSSVQRGNAEMQRRCQGVIDACIALGEETPIASIHDVGAGGLANAFPELVYSTTNGAVLDLRAFLSDEPGMSPLEIWCNESQERYALAIYPSKKEHFSDICVRENCPYSFVGKSVRWLDNRKLVVYDAAFGNEPVDVTLDFLMKQPAPLHFIANRVQQQQSALITSSIDLADAITRVLSLPAVASKDFLITIGDRSVGGLTCRDQMVGPWQMPVADVAVTATDYRGFSGEAMAVGERAPVAVIDPLASGRLAIGEAITNIAASSVNNFSKIKFSANWMLATECAGENAALYDTVQAVTNWLCYLGLSIAVGKDSLSMQVDWEHDGSQLTVAAPLSLVATAFAPVEDVRTTLTPQLMPLESDELWLIDLGNGQDRLGGSALAQVYQQLGESPADIEPNDQIKDFFHAIQALRKASILCAYHDRSDGGLLACVSEMAFAGNLGVNLAVPPERDALHFLFCEELGAVVQIRAEDRTQLTQVLSAHKLSGVYVGSSSDDLALDIQQDGQSLYRERLAKLRGIWWETSYRMRALRDNPECARQDYARICDEQMPPLSPQVILPNEQSAVAAPGIASYTPWVAILREQGTNGHYEMAAAFDAAGFVAVDVHMNDLLSGKVSLDRFHGLVAGGGFSYGDTLGAGRGWASKILHNPVLYDQFVEFFNRDAVFALGACNGCQMFSQIRDLIPGAESWGACEGNTSEQFESRLSLVEIAESNSILFAGMAGSRLTVPIAHREGRVVLDSQLPAPSVTLRYVRADGTPADSYPENPNGSAQGITGMCNQDGRFNIMMPHPERAFRSVQHSWYPSNWQDKSPWMQLFHNARLFLNRG